MNKGKYLNLAGAFMITVVFPYILKQGNEKEALSNSIFSIVLLFTFYMLLDYVTKNSDGRLRKIAAIWGGSN